MICPCMCQFKTPAMTKLTGFVFFFNEGLFSLFSLANSSHCSFYLLCFLKDSCGNQISAQSAKNSRNKEHQRGKQTQGFILLRCVCKDENGKLFVNSLLKGTTWTDETLLGSYFSFLVITSTST